MKGYIIFENFNKSIDCKEVLDGDYTCVISDYPNGTFSGVINRVTGARCNKSDTYDFETGALIALMKMCGVDKVVRACNEAFSEDTFKTYALKYERELRELKKDSDKVIDKLIEENKKLKLDCEKLQHMIFCGGRQNGKQSKREEMWAEIFAIHNKDNVIIKVKREDVNSFLHEIEKRIPQITWASGVKIFEAKGTIKDIYVELKRCNTIYFRLQKSNKLSYSSDPYIYPYYEFEHISYLPPMRWDLFKKGRKIVRVTPENIDDFIVKCTNKFGAIMKPNLKRYKDSTHAFIMISDYHYDNKPAIHIMTPEDLVRNQHENPKKYSDKKIVDWEDVR